MGTKIAEWFNKLVGKEKADSKTPLYPVNEQTKKIVLPGNVKQEIRDLIKAGNMLEATKRVNSLTGVGTTEAQSYVNSLAKAKKSRKFR